MSREQKDERFVRLAEARVNKIIKMIRLLGNCSNTTIYKFKPAQVDQIFNTLRDEITKAEKRFRVAASGRKRFSLSEKYETVSLCQYVTLPLPDGCELRATAVDDENFPAMRIDWFPAAGAEKEYVAYVEYNPEAETGHEICIGVHQADAEDDIFYKSYIPNGSEAHLSQP